MKTNFRAGETAGSFFFARILFPGESGSVTDVDLIEDGERVLQYQVSFAFCEYVHETLAQKIAAEDLLAASYLSCCIVIDKTSCSILRPYVYHMSVVIIYAFGLPCGYMINVFYSGRHFRETA